jgi:hypothetical protein
MPLLALAFVGVVVGAAGAEFLRAKQPELVKKIQASAKKFVKRFVASESSEE